MWAKKAGGIYNLGDNGFGIDTDDSDNILVTGNFGETATFGAGEANETSLTSNGGWDIFVAKYAPSGTLQWALKACATGHAAGKDIVIDGSDNILLTGYFDETATFGAGEAKETSLINDGISNDIFIAKYAPNGTLLWAKQAGGTSSDHGNGIAIEGSGYSLLTGWFSRTVNFGAGEANETTLTSDGRKDIIVAKYASNGTLLWAKKAGGTFNDYGNGIATDGSGNILVTGGIEGTATFGVGEANQTTLVNTRGTYIFVAKFSGEDGNPTGLAEQTEAASPPTEFALGQNYPNPFNPQTTIA